MVHVFLISLVLVILQVHGGLSPAHDHPAGDGSYRQREDRKAQQVDHDRKEGKGEKAEEGNEATGVGSHWDNDARFFWVGFEIQNRSRPDAESCLSVAHKSSDFFNGRSSSRRRSLDF
jgi:hypothetical protein